MENLNSTVIENIGPDDANQREMKESYWIYSAHLTICGPQRFEIGSINYKEDNQTYAGGTHQLEDFPLCKKTEQINELI